MLTAATALISKLRVVTVVLDSDILNHFPYGVRYVTPNVEGNAAV